MTLWLPRRPEGGYTLIEVAVASVPLALIALSLFAAFKFTVTFSRRGGESAEVVQQARFALHRMAAELREASAAPAAVVIWSRARGAPHDGVAFLVARVDGPGRAFVTGPDGAPRWQHAVYYIHDSATKEIRRITAGPDTFYRPPSLRGGSVLARQVGRLRLDRQGDLITITLAAARPPGEVVLATAVRPRN